MMLPETVVYCDHCSKSHLIFSVMLNTKIFCCRCNKLFIPDEATYSLPDVRQGNALSKSANKR